VRDGAGFASRCRDERVSEPPGDGAVVGLVAPRRGLDRSADLSLELADRPALFGCEPSELSASVMLGFGQ
jgi:hypothetical protein